ncbi:hypothetical protein MVES1_001813 [Malassezia vespertilionis]|uniref:mRNA stability protein n=1 Tax=Malassezia vespertilionis TaxID=2020962 RepID=A0A2N1JD15_9BASI|nr:uncharacterized protein MVES1_001813 [Malassezia vespertilionis]PKI84460.1 hypothetical protein MVES_001715 [Malassezia vespertilionis]WFD06468.1 hypothetical protein MVES1_001813 [Malassezia vespertilionis]
MSSGQALTGAQSLSEEDQKLFRLYGKLPNRKDLLANKLKERKYFDSGDYALSKAGRAPKQDVGTTIPSTENVPHAASGLSASPETPASMGLSPPSNHKGTAPVGIPGTSPNMSQHRHSVSMGLGASPSRSSFVTATGVHAGSPGREPTSSLAREQLPDIGN